MIKKLLLSLCVLAAPVFGQQFQAAPSLPLPLTQQLKPNILFILSDDLGQRDLGNIYADKWDNPNPALIPNIDALAAQGRRFTRMHSQPVCSTTRVSILSGYNPNEYSMGTNLETTPGLPYDLPFSAVTLPELLSLNGYSTAAFGKWHVSIDDGTSAPNAHGFDQFLAGSLSNLSPQQDYFDWNRIDNGVTTATSQYNTEAIGDSVRQWMSEQTGPWFGYVAFHAPHGVFQQPPNSLTPSKPFNIPGETLTTRERYDLMIEAMDTVIGEIMAEVPANTFVIFMSDNGTPPNAIHPLQTPGQVKRNVWREGIEVPLIMWDNIGWVTPGTTNGSILQVTDMYDTILEIAHAEFTPGIGHNDSISFVNDIFDLGPYFNKRFMAFSERYVENGSTTPFSVRRAVTGRRYKLIHQTPNQDGVIVEHLYDLLNDPDELNNLLLGSLTTQEQQAYQNLPIDMM